MSFGRDFLGRGWAFPFGFDGATGGVAMSEGAENIRQCISVILSTRPGERQQDQSGGGDGKPRPFAP